MHTLKCKILYSICTFPALFRLLLSGVSLRGICFFAGIPYVTRKRNSIIKVGKGCRFMSKSWGNLIGLNHRCILATTEQNAKLIIGNNCAFSGCSLWCFKEIILGNDVRCGANVLIMDGDAHQDDPRAGENKPIHIGNNVWVGADVKILKGVTIGDNTFIGAGSIVTKDIPANVVAVGAPCRVIRCLDEETINKLEKK